MLKLYISPKEEFDPVTSTFVSVKGQTLTLEHSLVSLSKWESKYCKPFLSRDNKTREQLIDYVECMTLTQNVDREVLEHISDKEFKQIVDYIEAPMTATTFSEVQKKPSREIITAEILYYDMIALNIPMECQKWHLNRLITLIRVCSIKNSPKKKKMSKKALAKRNASLNAARRAATGSSG